jgi:circadian clock protein KaiB
MKKIGKKKKATKKNPFEIAAHSKKKEKYILRLYISGATEQSQRALANVKRISEEYLKGHYDLQVIDIYQTPALAKGEQIVAVPTLIKKLPLPLRRCIGDMSNEERLLFGLDLKPKMKNRSG